MLAGNEAASPTPATNLTKEEASIMRQDSVPVAEREDGLGTFSKSMQRKSLHVLKSLI
jgi:hypothetical protein